MSTDVVWHTGTGKAIQEAIRMLTDNVLLEIFDHYRKNHNHHCRFHVWKWHILVQVCQKWRHIIFSSPRRLHLGIRCTAGTPVRKLLDTWPAIPIVMDYYYYCLGSVVRPNDEDNVIAVLEHPDRVCRIGIHLTRLQLGKISAVMQEPFPVLTHLSISTRDGNAPVVPGGFLGGSAPCLQEIELCGVPFPALPTLLLSASNLVVLQLENIPLAGYISPEVMVAHLAVLPRLKILQIELQSVISRPDQILLPPETRTFLPALRRLSLKGVCGYLEDFVARIDAPQLDTISIEYSDQAADFGVHQLSGFINHSEYLRDILSSHCEIIVNHDSDEPGIYFYIAGATSDEADDGKRSDPDTGITVGISCEGVYRRILHLTHVLSWISPVSDMVHLSINSSTFIALEHLYEPWLQLLRLFSSVQTLFVSEKIAGLISTTLENMAEVTPVAEVCEVLPALELLFLETRPPSSVDRFIAVRWDSDHPVTIVVTKTEFERRLKLYPWKKRQSSIVPVT
jgi:hypothetical protein